MWLFGPVVAGNLLVLFSVALMAWSTFWFVRRRTKDSGAAFLAGTIAGFGPPMIRAVNAGASEGLQAGWIPLATACFLELVREAENETRGRAGALRVAFGGAVAWAVASIASHWYFGVGTAMLLGLLYLAHLGSPARGRITVYGKLDGGFLRGAGGSGLPPVSRRPSFGARHHAPAAHGPRGSFRRDPGLPDARLLASVGVYRSRATFFLLGTWRAAARRAAAAISASCCRSC
ncbi:MAG: hypothetical protein M5R36_00020 [Deltaproteobacteria bacterium]|nr:hypothetical protein [Deltaproteobacteria bacterium]